MLIFLCHLSFVNGVQFLLTSFCYNVSLKFSQKFSFLSMCLHYPESILWKCKEGMKDSVSAGAPCQCWCFLDSRSGVLTIFWNVPIPRRVPCCFLNTRAVFHMFCLFLIFPERTLNFRTLCMVFIFHSSFALPIRNLKYTAFGKCQTSPILGVDLDPDLHWPL